MTKIIRQDGKRRVFIDEDGKETPFPPKKNKTEIKKPVENKEGKETKFK